VAPYEVPFGCEWSIVSKYPRVFQSETATNAWTPMGDAALGDRNHIGPSAWPTAQHSEPFPLPRGVGFEADVTSGSPILANVKHVEGVLHVGEAVAGPGIPEGTTITAVAGSTLTVSANPTETAKEVPLRSGVRYCLRVLARSDDDAQGKQVISEWTQMNGSQEAGFAFLAPPSLGEPEGSFVTPTSAYLQPGGSITPRTPYFTWRPVPAAQGYYVVIARDAGFTEVADVGFTNVPAYAPALANRVPLSDETTNYYWAVIPCTEEDGGGVHDDVPQDNNPHAFGKESAAPTLLSPANREAVYAQPTFKWTAVENARNYRIQVSQDPSFGHPLEDATTDATAYTSSSTYPADAPLYWRVRANDWIGQGLTWSAQGEFVRRLPAPVPLGSSPAGGGEPIPVLSWSAVQGAVGYELHVDKVNGLSANLSFPAGAAAPVEWYGVGVWRWKVRANFPTTTGLTATSAYSEPAQAFVRTLNAPAARGTRSGQRIVISWSPVSAAKEYEVDLSSTDGFAHTIESRRTDNASWAPQMKFSPAQKRGPLFWRVAAIDGNGNAGSFASGGFRGARVSCVRPSKKGRKPTRCTKKRASKKRR